MSFVKFNEEHSQSGVILDDDGLQIRINRNGGAIANKGKNSGKWYYEIRVDELKNKTYVGMTTGVGLFNQTLIGDKGNPWRDYVGVYTYFDSRRFYLIYDNLGFRDFTPYLPYESMVVKEGDIYGVCFDFNSRYFQYYKNGELFYEGSLEFQTDALLYPIIPSGSNSVDMIVTANFGKEPFVFYDTKPSYDGYLPYDLENAHPDNLPHDPNLYLFQCGDSLISPNLNKSKLIGNINYIGLSEEIFNEYGKENLNYIYGDVDENIKLQPIETMGDKDLYEIEFNSKEFTRVDRFEVR